MISEDFNENLKKYAHLVTETDVSVQDNHTVILQIGVDQTPPVHLITEKTYRSDAAEVIVQWNGEAIQRGFLTHAATGRIENVPQHKIDQTGDWIAKDVSRISVVSSNPDALAGMDAQHVAAFQVASGKALISLRRVTQINKVGWIVVVTASEGWTAKVFPELTTSEEQVDVPQGEILKTTRIYEESSVIAWDIHDKKLQEKAAELNEQQSTVLHYTTPGTDLAIGLPKNHLWEDAGSYNARGGEFMANMSTEEVSIVSDSHRVDSHVSNTKPLSYVGTIVPGMKFTFKDGEVVDFSAEQSEGASRNLLTVDESAKHLGGVTLVPDPSPTSQSGSTFYNTLFDENVSNHLVFGSAYAFNLQGGTEMNEEELVETDLNHSQTHVDFVVGSDKVNIDGTKEDGTIAPAFRSGDQAQFHRTLRPKFLAPRDKKKLLLFNGFF